MKEEISIKISEPELERGVVFIRVIGPNRCSILGSFYNFNDVDWAILRLDSILVASSFCKDSIASALRTIVVQDRERPQVSCKTFTPGFYTIPLTA